MANDIHVKWLKEGLKAWNSKRKGTFFSPDLGGENLRGMDLRGMNLREANFLRADLRGADLSKGEFGGAVLRHAKLHRAKLRSTSFIGAKLRGAKLQESNLQNANFLWADLRGADLRGADLRGANLSRTDLSGASELTQEQLESAKGDHTTNLPEGLEYPNHWPEDWGNEQDGVVYDDKERLEQNNLNEKTLIKKLAIASPVTAIVIDGRIAAVDSPPETEPPLNNPCALEHRLAAQEDLANWICSDLTDQAHNLPFTIKQAVEYYLGCIRKSPDNWYIQNNGIKAIFYYEEKHRDEAWPGHTHPNILGLFEAHKELEKYIRPDQSDVTSLKLPLPEINENKISVAKTKKTTLLAEALIQSEEAAVVLADSAVNVISIDIHNINESPIGPEKGLLGLAGFVATTIAALGVAITASVLTVPEAAMTLMASLTNLWEILASFFF